MATRGPGRARVGLAALCARWFTDVGLQTEAGDLSEKLQQSYALVVDFLQKCFGQVVAPGVITTVEEAAQAGRVFRDEAIDGLVLLHIMWDEDQPLVATLEATRGIPTVLWNYHPTGSLPRYLAINDLFAFSGTVGALQGSAAMQKLGIRLPIVSGAPGDTDLVASMRDLDAAFSIRRDLLGMAAGQIAGRCEIMTGTYVDEQALTGQFGIHLVEISAQEYAQACEAVAERRFRAFCAAITDRYEVEGVSTESLELACRNTLALDDLVARYGLGVVAIQDLDEELHRLAGVRPCLCPPESTQSGVAFGMESDLNATLGMLAAMRASSAPCMYTEIFTYDSRESLLLMGHAGVHDPALAAQEGMTIVPDAEYRNADRLEGAWQEFIMDGGPVTCVSLYDTGHGYRLTVFEGESLGGPRRLEGFAHALVRPAVPVHVLMPRLLQRGLTQHFIVAPGKVAGALGWWCEIGGIEFCCENSP